MKFSYFPYYLITNFISILIGKFKEIHKVIKGVNNEYEEMILNNTGNNKIISNEPMERRLMYGICSICNKVRIHEDWCKFCQEKYFKNNFKIWSSGDSKIDDIIQKSQLNATDGLDYLEWIDYKNIKNVEYITKGGFGKIFKATWINGPRHSVGTVKHDWRNVPNITIALKEMNHNHQLNRFLDEVQNHQRFLRMREDHVIRCLGITKSPDDNLEITNWLKDEKDLNKPKQNSFMMVMVWANDGNLFNYIENKSNDKKFTWYKRLEILEILSGAIETIHNKNMVHQDLHCGNILMDDKDKVQFPVISDLGLCGNYNQTGVLIGVIQFIAPEHLTKNSLFTPSSDIYSFGIIMWVICYCKLPYKDENFLNGLHLQLSIIKGHRPKISKNIPKSYVDLMKKCWHDDPKKRPKASDLKNIFLKWRKQCHLIDNEFFNAEKERLKRINNPDDNNFDDESDSSNNNNIIIPTHQEQDIERSKPIYGKSHEVNLFSLDDIDDLNSQ